MTSLKGHLLLATPRLIEPIFARSVILMLDHSEEGAAGLILNRPTEATLAAISADVFEEPSDWEKAVTLGGPVPGPLVILHKVAELSDQEVIDGVYTTVDTDKVRALVRDQPEPSLAVANYSGWGPGQLEGEIAEGTWFSLPARVNLVFWEGTGDLWKSAVKEYNARTLTSMLHVREVPDDPSVN